MARDPVTAIVGSRDGIDLANVRSFVRNLADKYPGAVVISGGAAGVDRTATHEADSIGLGILQLAPLELPGPEFKIDFTYNERARYLLGDTAIAYIDLLVRDRRYPHFAPCAFSRNKYIVKFADQVVAFWNSESKGTKHTIDHARKEGKPVHLRT